MTPAVFACVGGAKCQRGPRGGEEVIYKSHGRSVGRSVRSVAKETYSRLCGVLVREQLEYHLCQSHLRLELRKWCVHEDGGHVKRETVYCLCTKDLVKDYNTGWKGETKRKRRIRSSGRRRIELVCRRRVLGRPVDV